MSNYASVTLVGHLGRDVDTKSLPDGTTVANFSIATSRKRGGNEVTTWWRAALFGKRAEGLAQYAKKGDPLLIQGEPFMRSYTDKDGGERQSLEVAVSDFAFLKGRNDDGDGGDYQPAQRTAPAKSVPSPSPASWEDDDSSIPF